MINRIEKDEFGTLEVPSSAYYGINSLRNKNNFTVSKFKVHKQMIKSLSIVKKACALANYDAGELTKAQVSAICNACDEIYNGRFNNQFITDAIQGGSCNALNMNMNEVIANRANETMGGQLGKYEYVTLDQVNLFQSPNDVIPTSAKHSLLVLIHPLIIELKKLEKSFQAKAKKYKNVVKVGRNYLKDSLPVTFGHFFEALGSTVRRDIERLETNQEALKYINLGSGDVGIPYYANDLYVQNILNRFNEFTKVEFTRPENSIDSTRNLDAFLILSNALRLVAVNLSKTATDIRLMASGPTAGFNELILPSYEKLSGLSSGQETESVPEIVNQVCFQVIGKDMTVSLACEHGELEINAFSSVIYPNLFDSIEYLTRAITVFNEYCIKDLTVNVEACKEAVSKSLGVVVGLLGKIPYQTCVEIVNEARKTNLSIKEVCMKRNILDEKTLDELLEPVNRRIK